MGASFGSPRGKPVGHAIANPASVVVLGSLESWSIGDEEREFLREESPSGVTLFARNIAPSPSFAASEACDAPQTLAAKSWCDHPLAKLNSQLQGLLPAGQPPMLIAIDQEGGRVARLKAPFPNEGPALHLQAGSDHADALASLEAYGKTVGRTLAELGINVNFAPVVDVLTEPTNHAIGDRAFGVEPGLVSRRAGAFMQGLTAAGVVACLKHFPGQGHACVDTHVGSAMISKNLAELQACELKPFADLAAKAPMIMVSHCLYPALDGAAEASLSSPIIEGLLRRQMGYEGLVVSDDMTMGAITGKSDDLSAAIVRAVECGNDLVLVCRGLTAWRDAINALRQQALESPAFAKRLMLAAERVWRLRLSLGRGAQS